MFRKIYFALALIILLLCAACRNNTAEVSSEYKSEIAFTENSENTVAAGSDETDSSESALQSEQSFESLSSANDYQSRLNKTPAPDISSLSVADNSKVGEISSEPTRGTEADRHINMCYPYVQKDKHKKASSKAFVMASAFQNSIIDVMKEALLADSSEGFDDNW